MKVLVNGNDLFLGPASSDMQFFFFFFFFNLFFALQTYIKCLQY